MVGPSDTTTAFHTIDWSDAELLGVKADYGDLTLIVRESTGRQLHVICEGYVGYEVEGFWDEIVIERAQLEAEGPFLARCMASLEKRLGQARLPTGSEARNSDPAMQLSVLLGDGCQLNVVLKRLRVNHVKMV